MLCRSNENGMPVYATGEKVAQDAQVAQTVNY